MEGADELNDLSAPLYFYKKNVNIVLYFQKDVLFGCLCASLFALFAQFL